MDVLSHLFERLKLGFFDENPVICLNDWDWNPGVGMYGIIKAYENTKDKKYIDFLKIWFEKNKNTTKFGSVNNVILANVPLAILETEYNDECKIICDQYANWCMNKAQRTINGGFAHVWVGGEDDYKNQLWVDTVFMSVIFMVKYGIKTGNQFLISEGLNQLSIHIDCLFNTDTHLFYHGYHCISKQPLGVFWGRGNGWMAATIAEVLEMIMLTDYEKSKLITPFTLMMEKAFSLKEENGMLKTVIDCKESYDELTGTMLFAYGAIKGTKLGLLDEKFMAWSKKVLYLQNSSFDKNGAIMNCSHGTEPTMLSRYLTRPIKETPYANGIAMTLASMTYI